MRRKRYILAKGDLLRVVNQLGVSHSLVKQVSNGTYPSTHTETYQKVHDALMEISRKRKMIREIKESI